MYALSAIADDYFVRKIVTAEYNNPNPEQEKNFKTQKELKKEVKDATRKFIEKKYGKKWYLKN